MPLTPIAIKDYIATLTQTGTNAPIPNILKNSIPSSTTWVRTALGIYTATNEGAFKENKTTFPPFGKLGSALLAMGGGTPFSYAYTISRVNENEIALYTYNGATYESVELSTILGGADIYIHIQIYN